jgi:nitrite reductase/ring-hydroxylating ferredoxin subunit
MTTQYIEIEAGAPCPRKLASRVLAGEIFVARRCLQTLGIFDEITKTTLDAIKSVSGADTATDVERDGFETFHRHVNINQIEAITHSTYKGVRKSGPAWIEKAARELLGITKSYYFERCPNTRYHIPFDMMAADVDIMSTFAATHGGGKLGPHPNHRDSWVGCPDNLINIWAAVGPILEGNGLTIFPDAFSRDIAHLGASIAFDQNPGEPLTFNLEPGDAILFHGDHVHSSVLNRTNETRHAVSFRIVCDKPNFPHGHYDHYVHSSLAGGPFNWLAEVPASLAWSFFETRMLGAAKKFGLRKPERPRRNISQSRSEDAPLGGERTFALSSLPENTLRQITEEVCVARIGTDKLVAFDRRCPHDGGDLALGTVTNGEITCPWHNLRFDPETGASACKALRNMGLYPVRVEGDKVTVDLSKAKVAGEKLKPPSSSAQ